MRSPVPEEFRRVEILDVLRGVAVASVLLFHYTFRGAAADDFTRISLPALAPYTKYCNLGVQLFFVISGFVIAYSAEGRTAKEFAIARFARIYPGFIACMTLTFLVTLSFGAPTFQPTVSQWLANLVIDAPILKRPFMDGAYWSLICEITFYGWVTIFLMLGWFRRYIGRLIFAWLVLTILGQAIGSNILDRLLLTSQSGFFAAGLIIYEIYRGKYDPKIFPLMALATTVAIFQALQSAHFDSNHYHLAYSDGVVVAMSLAAIASVALALFIRRMPLPPKVTMTIGGVTYPLYLLHQNIGFTVFNRLGSLMPAPLIIASTGTAMILFAWAIWRYVDRPAQKFSKRLLSYLLSFETRQRAAEIFADWRCAAEALGRSRRSAAAASDRASVSSCFDEQL